MKTTDLPIYLTIEEHAALRRTTPNALRCERVRGGGPPAIKSGRRLLWNRDTVIAWLEGQRG